jgi:hypothetical protein
MSRHDLPQEFFANSNKRNIGSVFYSIHAAITIIGWIVGIIKYPVKHSIKYGWLFVILALWGGAWFWLGLSDSGYLPFGLASLFWVLTVIASFYVMYKQIRRNVGKKHKTQSKEDEIPDYMRYRR